LTKQLPPGQFETEKWPILHDGDVYQFDESTWEFRLFGDVKEEVSLSYQQVMELPKTISTIDMHCVTTWSKFDTTFEGIAFREFLRFVELAPDVKYVKIYGYLKGDRFGYSANLPLEALMGDDALFVYRWKDKRQTGRIFPQNMAIRSALFHLHRFIYGKERNGYLESSS
jgi:DMSO/TMAO reductase YedYZ molybdopterin-dependent catalytic subunit